jgi:hypothetical protein
MKKIICACLLAVSVGLMTLSALGQAVREATIEADTPARLVLQTHLNSKLSEVGDSITAVLYEPIYVNGQLVLSRGTEFHGRVTAVKPAGRPHKSGQITFIFERVAMPWGQEPVDILVTAIDDWDANKKMKADSEGKVSGGKDGEKTVDNVMKGTTIGGAGAGVILLSGGSGAAGAATLGGGALAGLFLTKGGEIQVKPGAMFRAKFTKPLTLPVVQQPGAPTRPQVSPDSTTGTPIKP